MLAPFFWMAMCCPMHAVAAEENPADHRCAKEDDVRLIEIRFEDEQQSLPCRVIYRPEAESDTVGTVSWPNFAKLDECVAQVEEVVTSLTEEGWACSADDRLAHATGPAETAQESDADAAVAVVVEGAGPTEPAQTDAENPPADAPPARLIDNPDLSAPPADLIALIKKDLQQLDSTLDGRLEAQIAQYGDLNADDIADALVLYTYSSPQPAYRQFLAAYLFDGETYQLTATKPVGGSAQATMDAKIEGIDQGIVHLSMQTYEPGDAACCPTGTRRIALALRNLDLVEIDRNTPTR
jgi:hypothetical protein